MTFYYRNNILREPKRKSLTLLEFVNCHTQRIQHYIDLAQFPQISFIFPQIWPLFILPAGPGRTCFTFNEALAKNRFALQSFSLHGWKEHVSNSAINACLSILCLLLRARTWKLNYIILTFLTCTSD